MTSNRRTRHPGLESPDEVKESLEIGLGRRGQDLDRWVTFRDLKDSGIGNVQIIGGRAALRGPGSGGPGDGTASPFTPPDFGQDDKTRPPAPTGVRANGLSLDAIGVTWNEPGYNNHAYAEVFASFSDNWVEISKSFNPNKPVGPGNRPQNFMGTASSTLFVHRNLSSTIPTVSFDRPMLDIASSSSGFIVTLDGDAREFASVGDTAYLTAPDEWDGNGIQGEVSSVAYVSGSGYTLVAIAGPNSFNMTHPTGAAVALIKNEDDLEAALNPQTIYYWVRFVSTAEVVGPVQSEAGVPGTVMLNPEEILNILTGRIRSSQLASDIVTPINFIRGPITELDESGNRKYPTVRDFVLAQGEGLISEYDEVWQEVIVGAIEPGDSEYGGIAAAAGLVKQIEAEANENGAYIQTLETLEAAFEESDPDNEDGLQSIISTIQSRKLVEATDEGAIAYIGDTVQISVDEDTYALNEIGSQVLEDHKGRLYNSITLKAQQNQGGILYAAGFGIGIEEDDDGEIESTVAFAADQFAIMSAANKGRIALRAQSVSSSDRTYTVVLDGGTSAADSDGLPVDAKVAITVPVKASQQIRNAFQGKTFKVINRSLNSFTNEISVLIEEQVGNDPPGYDWLSNFEFTGQNKGVAMFPEQSIPFIVNTTVDPPVVGIRGRLIVDGMITATDVEVTELLRANEIWAQSITAFGLINTSSLIGEAIATPRFGGWSVKMTAPDTSYQNRVFEFSRWLTTTDQLPDSDDPEDWIDQEGNYPQLRGDKPTDTSFWLDAQGNVFMRGSLQVGGNARILTYSTTPGAESGSQDYFVQMDKEFPLMVMPFADWSTHSGGAVPINQIPNYDAYSNGQTLRELVRDKALLWMNRDGTAGFNTAYESIFMGDTPMEAPAGGGGIRIITRKDSGALTGKGKVWISADFRQASNRFRPDSMVGFYVALYLVDASTDYGGYPMTQVPTQRNGVTMPDGSLMQPNLSGDLADYLNTHVLIIRAPDAQQGSEPDPGWYYYKQWLERCNDDGKPLIAQAGGYYNHSYPNQRFIQGIAEASASGNYRALLVVVERHFRDGTPVWGSIEPSGKRGACLGITQATIMSQQVSTRGFDGVLTANTGSAAGTGGGSSGGGTGPGNPDPGPGVDPEDIGLSPAAAVAFDESNSIHGGTAETVF